jgi:phosphopantothenoylcysteine decarboxylase/phosphopantothenate--cysteine ligase
MIETDDVLAELGRGKENRWVVGFALEAVNPRENALQKLRAKNCDVVVLNSPEAIGAEANNVELIDRTGEVLASISGTKTEVAGTLIAWIETHIARKPTGKNPSSQLV